MNEWEFIAIAAHSGRWRCQVKDTLEEERRRKNEWEQSQWTPINYVCFWKMNEQPK